MEVYLEAVDTMEKGKDLGRVREELAEAKGHFQHAVDASNLARTTFTQALAARAAAEKAESSQYAAKDWQRAEEALTAAAATLEGARGGKVIGRGATEGVMTRFASTALISAALALAACQRVEDAPVPTVTPDAEVGVQPARADDGASDGTMTDALWRLVAIRRPGGSAEPVAADPSYYVEFRADAHYAGRAHCNSFTGEYEHPAPGVLHIRAGAATLAACPQPSIADEYLRALASVTHYEVTDDELRLSYNTSGELEFHRIEIEIVPEVHAGFELAPARTFVYDCDGDVSFTARTGPGEVALWAPEALGGTYQVLSLARSG